MRSSLTSTIAGIIYRAVVASVVKRANGTFSVDNVWMSFDAGTKWVRV